MEEQTCRPDPIDNLPDGVLLRIVSFLPLEEAVRTSILSRRWKNLWTPTRLDIHIDQKTFRDSSRIFTDKFLSSFDSPRSQNFCLFHSGEELPENEVTIIAVKGVQKEVYLQFLPSKETNLLGFELKLGQTLKPPPAALSSSLRTLHVRSVSNLGSSFVSSIFSSCRFLETLKLEKCNHLRNVTVEENNRLESLSILDCPELENVSVSAVKLVSFYYRGVLPMIEFKNVPSLTEVELDLSSGPRYGREFECEDVINLFDTMREIEKLKISGWLLEWLSSGGVIYGMLQFKFSKLKELTWIDTSMDEAKRDSLAFFLNICPVLTKLFINIKRKRSCVERPLLHQHWPEPEMWLDYAAMKASVLPLKNLRVVEMSGFALDEEEEMMMQLSLLDLFLDKAVMLDVMSIISSA